MSCLWHRLGMVFRSCRRHCMLPELNLVPTCNAAPKRLLKRRINVNCDNNIVFDELLPVSAGMSKAKKPEAEPLAYNTNLRAEIEMHVNDAPRARVHSVEWRKIMTGEPVEINPSIGHGYKIMPVSEWSARWKRNDDFPDCLQCKGTNTKEHHFTQTWCRGKKLWESELLCLDCHHFSWRSYKDPDFKTPEEFERERWDAIVAVQTSVLA